MGLGFRVSLTHRLGFRGLGLTRFQGPGPGV